jgi:2-polyprenyl-3-methyl-5-hydroxy-6-metoxy-1,4-benzoquinol methylase
VGGDSGIAYVRPSQHEIRDLVLRRDDVDEYQRDSMAIPTYLHSNPLIRWLFHRRYRTVASLIDVPPGSAVLEFGCGVGVFLPSLCAAGFRVFAADLETRYARRLTAQRKIPVRFISDMGELDEGCVDAIVAADVLEHVDDLPQLVSQMKRALSPRGVLVVSGPTENFVYRIGRVLAGFAGKGEYHHSDAESVESTIESLGFVREAVRTLPWRIPPHLFRVVRFRMAEA